MLLADDFKRMPGVVKSMLADLGFKRILGYPKLLQP
jgi:hypothetical protein